MRKLLVILSLLLMSFNAFADGITAYDVTLKDDVAKSLDFVLSNSATDIVGLQFNLSLPKGVNPVMNGNKVVITPSARLKGSYLLRGSKVADESYLFTFLSNNRTPINGTSGVLFTISLQNSSANNGSYEANISGVTITNMTGNEQSLPDATFSISIHQKYKLTYYVDGVAYKSYYYAVGEAITPETAPIKEGYTFSGWNNIPATMPAHDVTVTGSFTINKYKVTFISDGQIVKEEMLDYGSVITPPVNPTKEGCTFAGWSPAVDANVPSHDVFYTAQFSVNQYTINFDTDGGSSVAPITQDYGTPITKPADPTKEGYTFAGWSPAIPTIMAAKNLTVKAQWTINSYKLTYMVDGAVYKECILVYGEAITPEAAPVKEGYTFSGWGDIPTTMPAHDVIVNGSFTKGAYKLIYYVDGVKYKEYGFEYGDAVSAESAPTKEGYTFSGWSEIPETMPDHDVKVNGSFSINQYKVTFISDGTIVQETIQNYGTAIVIPDEPAKEGHTFIGWDPEVDATVPARDVTYSAQFKVNSYMLSYLVDGEIYKEFVVEYGAIITPESAPVKEGYTFSGWSEIPETMPAHNVKVNGSFSPILVSSIILEETTIEMFEGATYLLHASVFPENAANPGLVWISNNTSIATVSSEGLVTAISVGTVVITVTAADGSGVSSTCRITVEPVIHVYVDLGLPSGTLWATCNVGANSPEEYGGQYAWGETETKENYSLEAYKWCNGTQNSLTKYCTDSDFGIVDNKTELDLEDDVAHVKWGGSWRMPTIDEIAELSNLCTWEWTVLNGIYGYRVTGKNGNSIFLPAAGFSVDGLLNGATNEMAYYYSSSLTTTNPQCAEILVFWKDNLGYGANLRYYGRSVRPVMSSKGVDPSVQTEYVDLGLPSRKLWAKRNVGAASAGDGGYHLAWGEVFPKEVYDWSTYFDTWDGGNSFVEYNTSNGNRELKPEHDAAYYHFGSNWRTPSYYDLMELRDECIWELSEEDGNEGFRITGPNGNTIFLPAAGIGVDDRMDNVGELGDYWANTRADAWEDYADGMGFLTSQGVYSFGSVRYYGECVRPIFVGDPFHPIKEPVSSITILNATSQIKYGESIQFFTEISPMTASNKILSWTSDDASVATVSANGTVLAVGIGSTVITASATDGSNVKTQCIVTVQSDNGLPKVMIDQDYEGIFTLDGRKVDTMQNGIYIVRMKDGSAKIVQFK